jgi:hypothetical protein
MLSLRTRLLAVVTVLTIFVGIDATPASAQATALKRGSDNIQVLGHIPLGPTLSVSDMDLEQELSRPYAYVSRMRYGAAGPRGLDIISIENPERPERIYQWRIEDQELHLGTGAMDVKHFKVNGRYYVVQSLQFGQGGPDSDLGAVILDVNGLPDVSTVREVARIREPLLPGGFHNIFVYKHSDGRVLLMATVGGPYAHVYDLGMVVQGADADDALVGRIPNPQSMSTGGNRGYHDFYAAYHPDTDEDRFYGGGGGGYYIYDITNLSEPQLRVTLTGISGVSNGHTFTPSPDGRYVVAESEYEFAPLRFFDLKPALDGEVANIRRPISGWTADFRNLVHNHEVRWPLLFVSGYLDGLQVVNLQDPTNPMTVGYYDTYIGPRSTTRTPVFNGAFGVDIRNADGLIAISDMSTGFWTFRMDGFQGWNGEDWGMPNISSAQNWDQPTRRPISDQP